MSTSTPSDPGPSGPYDFVRWLIGDSRQAGLIYFAVLVAAVVIVIVTWLLAPHVGAILSALIGGGGLVVRRWRRE